MRQSSGGTVASGPPVLRSAAGVMASEDEAALFRTTFSDSPVGTSVATPDGRVRAVNPALCRLLGYSPAEFLTISLDDVVHPDDRAHVREGLRALLSGTHT